MNKGDNIMSTVLNTNVHYESHPLYLSISSNTKLTNVGKDVTNMMLSGCLDKHGMITQPKLFEQQLKTMEQNGKRPPSSTKGSKEDYTDDMIRLEVEVNKLIKGKKFNSKKNEEYKPMFYFRNLTKLNKNKSSK
jgi:hypothetical protein|tara:strand:- start:525 stop:926 length:402 start_codon:yes stop_codon:yes gene_type:complete